VWNWNRTHLGYRDARGAGSNIVVVVVVPYSPLLVVCGNLLRGSQIPVQLLIVLLFVCGRNGRYNTFSWWRVVVFIVAHRVGQFRVLPVPLPPTSILRPAVRPARASDPEARLFHFPYLNLLQLVSVYPVVLILFKLLPILRLHALFLVPDRRSV
jgi:hypothetical protein